MDTIEAIMTRKSVRKYKTDPVPDEILSKVLEATRWAPSWKNNQCWKFIVIRDRKKMEEIAATLIGNIQIKEALSIVPVLIIACAELGKSGLHDGKFITDKGDWYMFDVALAMENLCLAAHSLGLGTVHVALIDSQKIERILGVPEGVKVVELTPLGYPAEPPRFPGRKELSEIIFRERYGQP